MDDTTTTKRLLLLCHRGGWEHAYQSASAAATAATMGWRVDVVLYFDALARWIDGRLDEADDGEHERVELAEERDVRPPSALFAAARASGRFRVHACSASLGLIDRDVEAIDGTGIDDVIGWPTTIALIEGSDQSLYL